MMAMPFSDDTLVQEQRRHDAKPLRSFNSKMQDVVFDQPQDELVLRFDTRYLSSELAPLNERLRHSNVIFVKSPKGTGKTQWLKQFLDSGQFPAGYSVAQIGHRQSLERLVSNAWELVCYLDDKQAHQRYAVTLDSIHLLDRDYDVVVIDEIEQVLRHLIGDTLEQRRGLVASKFFRLIQKAKHVVCLDADLTGELTGQVISKLRHNFEHDKVVAIVNEWQANRVIAVYEDRSHLIAELITMVSEGKRVYVPVSLLKVANDLERLLKYCRKPNGERIRVLSLTGQTSQLESATSFFAAPSTECLAYDVILATSTLGTGVSIDAEHFDAIVGIFDRQPYTYQDCDQAISRVRKCNTVKVWIHQGQQRQYRSVEDAKQGSIAKEIMTRRYWLDEEPKLSPAETLAVEVMAQIAYCEDDWRHDRLRKFINLKQADGWFVCLTPSNAEMVSAGKELLKIAKDPDGDAKYRRVLEAENITRDDVDFLRDQKNISATDKLAVEKYWIAQFYELESPAKLTVKQIKDYKEQDFRDKAKALRLIAKSENDAIALDKYDRLDENRLFIDMKHRAKYRALLADIADVAGIDPINIMARAARYAEISEHRRQALEGAKPGSRPARAAKAEFNRELEKIDYHVTTEQIDKVADYVATNLDIVNLFLGTKFEQPTRPDTKTKVFNATLGKLGVCIQKRVVTKDKVSQTMYFVDFDMIAEMAAKKDLAQQ